MPGKSVKECAIAECGSRAISRGLCNKHYLNERRRGRLPVLNKSTEDRFWEKVDKTQDCWVWTAASKPAGYGEFYFAGQVGYAHRYAYERFIGPVPDGMVIDHKCRNKGCVRPDHLHAVEFAVNMQNLGIHANNSSGYRGVSFHKRSRSWRAYVGRDGKYLHAGYHSTAEDAAEAARELRLEIFKNSLSDMEKS